MQGKEGGQECKYPTQCPLAPNGWKWRPACCLCGLGKPSVQIWSMDQAGAPGLALNGKERNRIKTAGLWKRGTGEDTHNCLKPISQGWSPTAREPAWAPGPGLEVPSLIPQSSELSWCGDSPDGRGSLVPEERGSETKGLQSGATRPCGGAPLLTVWFCRVRLVGTRCLFMGALGNLKTKHPHFTAA